MNEKITLNISGMSCGHCEKTVSNTVKKLNGIHDVKINLATATAEIEYDQQLVKREEIVKAINDTEIYSVND